MAAQWKFDKDGNITDGSGVFIAFNKLVKYENGAVRDINNNALPIAVSDADSLGGVPSTDFALKTELPYSNKFISKTVGGVSAVTNTTNIIAYSQAIIKGQSTRSTIASLTTEYLPNIVLADLTNITAGNGAVLTTANNVLTVTANVTDNPFGSMDMTLTAGVVYVVKYTLGGITPSVRIEDTLGNIIKPDAVEAGTNVITIKPVTTGTHRFVMSMLGIGDADAATFSVISVTEMDMNNIAQGDYWSHLENGNIVTNIKTGVTAKELIYDTANVYSNLPKENIAITIEDLSMIQYIGPTSGDSGYVLDSNGNNKEYLTDASGVAVGTFTNAGDVNEFTVVGNTTKTVTNGALVLTRSLAGGNLEVYHDISGLTGKVFMVEFNVSAISSGWSVFLGSKEVKINTVDVNNRMFRLVYTSVEDVPRLRFVCASDLTGDAITLDNISVKELDPTIWKDITPTVNETSTPIFEWDSADIQMHDLTPTLNSLGYNIRNDINTINLKSKIRLASSTNANKGFIYTANIGVSYSNDIFTNDSGISGGNAPGSKILVDTFYMDRVVIYKNSHGMLQLSVYNSETGYQLVMQNNTANSNYSDIHSPYGISPDYIEQTNIYDLGYTYYKYFKDSGEYKGEYGTAVLKGIDGGIEFKDTKAFSTIIPTSGVQVYRMLHNSNMIKSTYYKSQPNIITIPTINQPTLFKLYSNSGELGNYINYGDFRYLVRESNVDEILQPVEVSNSKNSLLILEYSTTTTSGYNSYISNYTYNYLCIMSNAANSTFVMNRSKLISQIDTTTGYDLVSGKSVSKTGVVNVNDTITPALLATLDKNILV